MATGASNADLAILLIDARKGLLTQTRRHALIVSLLGIRHVVLAVNKIDLVDYDEATFRADRRGLRGIRRAARLSFARRDPDLGARRRQRVFAEAPAPPGTRALRLLAYLEACDVEEDRAQAPFRLPVQWVNRPDLDFRGYAGTIASGRVRRGDAIVVAALRARSPSSAFWPRIGKSRQPSRATPSR